MTSKQQSPAQIDLPPDELTLHLIASGLYRLAEQVNDHKPPTLPYPTPLQRGLDRLVVSCLRQGATPPHSLPDLLDWCRRPLNEWHLALPPEAIAPTDALLDGDRVTGATESWACASPDVEAELSEQRFFISLYNACRTANAQETYVAFRRLLIRQPVLTEFELQRRALDPELTLVSDHLQSAYETAPRAFQIGDEYIGWGYFGKLLTPASKGSLQCEEEHCRLKGRVKQGRRLPARQGVLWLKRGLRRFIAAPGRAELRLAERLQKLGLQVELWPAFDNYDLRLTFSNDEAWAVDVKDWANPFLLARQVKPFPATPPWTRAYFVFPNERQQQRADYVRAFRHHCPILNRQTRAKIERKFLADVRQKLRE